jgi:hypothetical protein
MSSHKRKYNRFPVGKYVALQRQLKEQHKHIKVAEMELNIKRTRLHAMQERLRRTDEKVSEI